MHKEENIMFRYNKIKAILKKMALLFMNFNI